MSLSQIEVENIINKTAAITAKITADELYAKLTQERKQKEESLFNLRLYNTKLLLEHYRLFKEHAENAISDLDDIDAEQITAIEIMDSMLQSPVDKGEIALESIRNSALRTKIVIEHIDSMLGIYEAYCEKSLKPEDYRRWDIINTVYIKDMSSSMTKMEIYEDLADKHIVTVRQIQNDLESGIVKLTALLFGIDGVKRFTQRSIRKFKKETDKGRKQMADTKLDSVLLGESDTKPAEKGQNTAEFLQ